MSEEANKPYVPKMNSNDFLVQIVKGDFDLCKSALKAATKDLSTMQSDCNSQRFRQLNLLKKELTLKIKEHESNN